LFDGGEVEEDNEYHMLLYNIPKEIITQLTSENMIEMIEQNGKYIDKLTFEKGLIFKFVMAIHKITTLDISSLLGTNAEEIKSMKEEDLFFGSLEKEVLLVLVAKVMGIEINEDDRKKAQLIVEEMSLDKEWLFKNLSKFSYCCQRALEDNNSSLISTLECIMKYLLIFLVFGFVFYFYCALL